MGIILINAICSWLLDAKTSKHISVEEQMSKFHFVKSFPRPPHIYVDLYLYFLIML